MDRGDHKGRRKAKRVGVGPEGKKAAKTAAEKIQAKLALGEPNLLGNDQRGIATVQRGSRRLACYLRRIGTATNKHSCPSIETTCGNTFTLGLALEWLRRSSGKTFAILLPTFSGREEARAWFGTWSLPCVKRLTSSLKMR